MAYSIDQDKCMRCGTCEIECPFHAVLISNIGTFSIDPDTCKSCGICLSVCPVDAPFREDGKKAADASAES
ncbi:MAG: 4Fe-4S binding protein [Clostridia bacterium]|nr:4Fe-4S binding protein [Clostridia bacterium]MBO4798669.1 4Fe-4S binding protein [Candidatus Methanomethylophilaceae archaeon]